MKSTNGGSIVAMPRRMRCAVYTRKSSEEGLDMEFNSLDAQREACEAYISSQRAEGWGTVRDSYDDGGFSGGTLERPALHRLLADIAAGLIDVIVVYKIDRLSRALMDFSRLVEIFGTTSPSCPSPKGTAYPGEHRAIVERALWDKVHSILQKSPRQRAANTRNQTPALLRGLIFGPTGAAMTPTMTKKGSRLYRYYVSMDVIRNRDSDAARSSQRLPAGVVEGAVVQEIRMLVRTPEIMARTVAAVQQQAPELNERDVIAALNDFDALWGSLFPAEQARIVHLLVQRVSVSPEGIAVDLRTEGLSSVIREMITPRTEEAIASPARLTPSASLFRSPSAWLWPNFRTGS